jgi:hypothetical protein
VSFSRRGLFSLFGIGAAAAALPTEAVPAYAGTKIRADLHDTLDYDAETLPPVTVKWEDD